MIINQESRKLSSSQFQRLSKIIYNTCGIQLPVTKKVMVEARLSSRIKKNNLQSMDEYLDKVFNKTKINDSVEFTHLIDAITTNKTDFFREPAHYGILRDIVLPDLLKSKNKIDLWSAGCSSGEEPYTLAIVFEEYKQYNKHFSFQITASDLSTEILSQAMNAVYSKDKVKDISPKILSKYFLKSSNPRNKVVKVKKEIRNSVRFGKLNFMDQDYGLENDFDIAFCRNVIIYFDRPTQEQVLKKITAQLNPGGYLFIGHSESVHNMNLTVKQIAPTVFKKI